MKCGVGLCGHCQLGPLLVCRDGPVVGLRPAPNLCSPCGSCDDCDDQTEPALARASPSGSSRPATAASSPCSTARTSCWPWPARVRIASLPRGVQRRPARAVRPVPGRGLHHHRRTTRSGSAQVREQSRFLVTIGACATAGGIQALRNFADVDRVPRRRLRQPAVHRHAGHVHADRRARPGGLRAARLPDRQGAAARGDHRAAWPGRKPDIPDTSVCTECKRRGLTCVMVADGTPCLGPVTHAGCGALCPAVRPRLLRLLRAGDRRQRAGPDPAAAPLRDAAGQGRPGPFHLQRRRPGLRRGPPGKDAR